MNSVAGLVKPECRMMLSHRRFYATQVRRKKQPKSKPNEPDTFKFVDIQTTSLKNLNPKKHPERVNEFGLQMLPECLYKQIYNGEVQKKPDPVLLEKAKRKLRKFGLGISVNYQKDVELKLPNLRGNIEEHFWNIGDEQSKPYRVLVERLVSSGLPEPPEEWVCQPGWTKYTKNKEPVQVHHPEEDALVMDVEVSMKSGRGPTLATAVSSKAWYGWVSPNIVKETNPCNLELFIPLGKVKKPSVVVGHAVSFDRAHVKEQYNIQTTGLRFLDTMALHISVGTFTSKRHLVLSYISLKDLYQFYCNKTLNKEKKSLFVTGGLSDIRTNFQDLMTYCANDSRATYEVLQVIFPKFLEHFPHPVTLAGMLEMSMCYLPVNQNWDRFVKNSNDAYDDLKDELTGLLVRKTNSMCKLMHNDEYKTDLWMWGENWKTERLKLTNSRSKPKKDVEMFDDEEEQKLHDRFKYLFDLEGRLPKRRNVFLPGYPLWYRLLCGEGQHLQLSPGKLITPKILRIKWENFPLHYVKHLGWGILIPDIHAKDIDTSIPFELLKALAVKNLNIDLNQPDTLQSVETYYKGDGLWCDRVIDNCCYFYKIARNERSNCRNVRSIFSRNFTLSHTSLSSDDTTTNKVIRLSEMISFWGECKSSIKNEMIVWVKDDEGVILPRVTVCGTITRRASENLWLRPIPDNGIGSELRSMVQAPTGYHIIGGYFDLDVWIASLLGDSAALKIHGSTPLGYVTLNGINSINTVIAKHCNLPLRQAEFLTTCRLTGSGIMTTEKHIKRLNPHMTSVEARKIARKIYYLTKGIKVCQMKNSNKVYYIKKAKQLAKARKKVFEDVFFKPFWYGGMESTAHNTLEEAVTTSTPTTPFLSSRISEALNEENMQWRKFSSMVQSSGVDFLHLMLVCMRWLTNGKARYCFSFHNEVRYLIPSEDRYNGALALQVCCLLVKAFCSHKLGMYDLPLSSAFFPAIGIDTTLRREVCNEYVTPSNPHGLHKGYGIPPGEVLDIYDAIEKSGGNLSMFGKK